jgi:hypothetical protein
MKVVLLVTWIVNGHAINSYQVPFSTMALCKNAQMLLQGEAVRFTVDTQHTSNLYQVSALCVEQ